MRRTARPEPSVPITALESRLAGGPTPQYNQTGVGAGSTSNFNIVNLMASGTVQGSVGTFASLTIGSSAPRSMAFQSATGVSLTGPLTMTGFVASSGLVTGYFPALTSTGGVVKIAIMST